VDNAPNGKSRLDRLEEAMVNMLESQQRNWEEHERIWKSIEALRDQDFEIVTGIKQLTSTIRDLIDRIPPENLR
jgi:hypothetical protein